MKKSAGTNTRQQSLSLLARFNIISLALLVVGSILVSSWVSRQIELRVLARVGHTTSLFADSVFAPEVENLVAAAENGEPIHSDRLDMAVLGEDVVAFKIWAPDGLVLFSSNPQETGQRFAVEEGLEKAAKGVVSTEISDLDRDEHALQRVSASRLIETYAPIRRPGSGEIVAVIEFYQDVEAFTREIRSARRQTWAIVGALVAVTYAGLVLIFRGGSRTIEKQQRMLERRVLESEQLLAKNTELANRLRASAVRTTTLTEEYLRRIAAELHDGPAQDIGYALLGVGAGADDRTRNTLRRALEEIRTISAGLRSPELQDLPLEEVVARAVAIHRSRTGNRVNLRAGDLAVPTHAATKITVYRLILEALSNAARHAGDPEPVVEVFAGAGCVTVIIADRGPGIRGQDQPETRNTEIPGAHLGLAVMRERVELLGGTLEVSNNKPSGTVITATIPTFVAGGDDQ